MHDRAAVCLRERIFGLCELFARGGAVDKRREERAGGDKGVAFLERERGDRTADESMKKVRRELIKDGDEVLGDLHGNT